MKTIRLYLRKPTLTLREMEPLTALFRTGAPLSLDGKEHTVVGANLSNPTQDLWELTVAVEVSDG
jgi:hypothetical protein